MTANFLMQLGSLAFVTREIFVGYSVFMEDGSVALVKSSTPLIESWVDSETSISTIPTDDPVGPPGQQIVWGDVLRGIEVVIVTGFETRAGYG